MGEFEYQKRIVQKKNRDVLADFEAMYNSVIKASIQAFELKEYAETEDEYLEAYNLNNDEFAKLHRLAVGFMYLENPESDKLRDMLITNMPLYKADGLKEQNDKEQKKK